MKKTLALLFVLLAFTAIAQPPVVRTYFTTNSGAVVSNGIGGIITNVLAGTNYLGQAIIGNGLATTGTVVYFLNNANPDSFQVRNTTNPATIQYTVYPTGTLYSAGEMWINQNVRLGTLGRYYWDVNGGPSLRATPGAFHVLATNYAGFQNDVFVTNNLNVGGTFTGNGSGLTNINADNLASGTLPMGRLTSNVRTNGILYTDGAQRLWATNLNWHSTGGLTNNLTTYLGDDVTLGPSATLKALGGVVFTNGTLDIYPATDAVNTLRVFTTNSTTPALVVSSNRVGVGTVTPAVALDVVGAITANGGISGTVISGSSSLNSGSGVGTFRINSGGAGATLQTFGGNGLVYTGLGFISTNSSVTFSNTVTASNFVASAGLSVSTNLSFDNTAGLTNNLTTYLGDDVTLGPNATLKAGGGVVFTNSTLNIYPEANAVNTFRVFTTNSLVPPLVVTSNRVGIGLSAPNYLLEVNGIARMSMMLSDLWQQYSAADMVVKNTTSNLWIRFITLGTGQVGMGALTVTNTGTFGNIVASAGGRGGLAINGVTNVQDFGASYTAITNWTTAKTGARIGITTTTGTLTLTNAGTYQIYFQASTSATGTATVEVALHQSSVEDNTLECTRALSSSRGSMGFGGQLTTTTNNATIDVRIKALSGTETVSFYAVQFSAHRILD